MFLLMLSLNKGKFYTNQEKNLHFNQNNNIFRIIMIKVTEFRRNNHQKNILKTIKYAQSHKEKCPSYPVTYRKLRAKEHKKGKKCTITHNIKLKNKISLKIIHHILWRYNQINNHHNSLVKLHRHNYLSICSLKNHNKKKSNKLRPYLSIKLLPNILKRSITKKTIIIIKINTFNLNKKIKV